MNYPPRGQPSRNLSPREVEVLRSLLAGETQAQIDRRFGSKTSRLHIARVKDKYQLSHLSVDALLNHLRRIRMDAFDVGDTVTLRRVEHQCAYDPPGTLSHYGYIETHRTLDGEPCDDSMVQTCQRCNPQRQRWVETQGPSLDPSLLCLLCGRHGWITGGRWKPVPEQAEDADATQAD